MFNIRDLSEARRCQRCGGRVSLDIDAPRFPGDVEGYRIRCQECGIQTKRHKETMDALNDWNREWMNRRTME